MIAVIDQLDDDWAVLSTEDGEVRRVPRSALPARAREGDAVELDTMQLDPAATERLRSEIAAARARARKKSEPPGDL
ncbi:MAG: DUF3006 domain-containing protein [Myxococcaceae bacterium]|nr:DUF3006 domain-containing protein [Myxococcaceae bacterium]